MRRTVDICHTCGRGWQFRRQIVGQAMRTRTDRKSAKRIEAEAPSRMARTRAAAALTSAWRAACCPHVPLALGPRRRTCWPLPFRQTCRRGSGSGRGAAACRRLCLHSMPQRDAHVFRARRQQQLLADNPCTFRWDARWPCMALLTLDALVRVLDRGLEELHLVLLSLGQPLGKRGAVPEQAPRCQTCVSCQTTSVSSLLEKRERASPIGICPRGAVANSLYMPDAG